MKHYEPTPAEARAHLRRWSAGRRQLAALGAPVPWQAVATDAVLARLDELEKREAESAGMVVTELEDWNR